MEAEAVEGKHRGLQRPKEEDPLPPFPTWSEEKEGPQLSPARTLSPAPWAALQEEMSPAQRWLAGHQACLPPRGRCLSLEGMGLWFSFLAWPLLCFLSFWELTFTFSFFF